MQVKKIEMQNSLTVSCIQKQVISNSNFEYHFSGQ